MYRLYRLLLICALLCLPLLQAGCLVAAAAAGAGGVAYLKGDLQATVEADPQQVVEASKKAVDDLNFTLISANGSSLDGQVIARTGKDTRVHIDVKSQHANMSRVSIRIGNFGDQAMSQQILERIKANLKAPATATAASAG